MALTSPARVDAPTVTPALGGLLAAATVIDSTDPHIGYGVEWFTFACGPAGIAPGMCEVADGVVVDPEKLFEGGSVVQAPPFAVYAGVVCDLFGRTYDAEVRARLAGGEERVVGRAFYQALFLGLGTGITPVQVGGSAAVTRDTIVDVIAELEQFAGENYAGRPVLHMNKETATWAIAADVVSPSLDGTLITGQGTPVANSPGYPDGLIFLTGEVRIWRTPVDVHTVDAVAENQAYALAERIYAVGTDCLLAYAGEEITPPPPFAVTDIDPASVTVGADQEFTITGTGFDSNLHVTIDGEVVDVTIVSPTEATFTWTAGDTPGTVDVHVARGADFVDVPIQVTVPAPTITAVVPTTGPEAGGTVLTVTGTGFLEGA